MCPRSGVKLTSNETKRVLLMELALDHATWNKSAFNKYIILLKNLRFVSKSYIPSFPRPVPEYVHFDSLVQLASLQNSLYFVPTLINLLIPNNALNLSQSKPSSSRSLLLHRSAWNDSVGARMIARLDFERIWWPQCRVHVDDMFPAHLPRCFLDTQISEDTSCTQGGDALIKVPGAIQGTVWPAI